MTGLRVEHPPQARAMIPVAMDERTVALLEQIAEALARIERELARANEQLADIRNALYS